MANIDVGAWCRSEILSRSHSSPANESGGAVTPFDDGLDFPPTAHPFIELVTFSIFVMGVIALIVWGGSKLL
jgi:hypothetical protein